MRAATRSWLGAGSGVRVSALHQWARRVYVDSAHVWRSAPRAAAPRAAASHRWFIASPAVSSAGDDNSTEEGGDVPAPDSRERRERHGSVVFGGGAGSEIREGQRFMAVDAEVRRAWHRNTRSMPSGRCRGVCALGT